jgi:hypothetical protein
VPGSSPSSYYLVFYTFQSAPSPQLSAYRPHELATIGPRRLAAVATIFLPISCLAGFWGENFNILTGSIEKGWPAFLALGVGLSVACVAVTVVILSRRSWN